MKVLMINGSPRENGNTALALKTMRDVFTAEGIDTELIQIGRQVIRGCIACNSCAKLGRCVFDDIVNETAAKFEKADGLVIGSPVYYGSPNGTLLSLLDRLFYSTAFDKTMKVGTAVTAARRSGLTASFDVLNKYFSISGMPIATSRYWNNIHGLQPGEAVQDEEGLRVMRILARNMTFLMKSIALGRDTYGIPADEKGPATNFIR